MRVLPIHVIPIFLDSGVLPDPGVGGCGAQIRYFDVYYRVPPVVGFSIIGCACDSPELAGFFVEGPRPQDNC